MDGWMYGWVVDCVTMDLFCFGCGINRVHD